MLKGLLAAVNEPFGTAYGSRLTDVVMAGKTGTAQVVKMGARRLKAEQVSYFERDHAWFAAFAPAEDPEIVVVVLNEHSGFGSSKAAPTASAVVRRWLELKAPRTRRSVPARPRSRRPRRPPPPARSPVPTRGAGAAETPKLGGRARAARGGARG